MFALTAPRTPYVARITIPQDTRLVYRDYGNITHNKTGASYIRRRDEPRGNPSRSKPALTTQGASSTRVCGKNRPTGLAAGRWTSRKKPAVARKNPWRLRLTPLPPRGPPAAGQSGHTRLLRGCGKEKELYSADVDVLVFVYRFV